MAPQSSFRVGEYGNVVFDIIGGPVGKDELDALFKRLEEKIEANPGGTFAFLNIIEEKAPLPDPALRKVIGERIAKFREKVSLSNTLVIEAKGFTAVSVRAVVAGLSFVSGDAIRTFGTVEEAANELAKEMASGASAEFVRGLSAAIAETRGKAAA